VNHGQVFFQLVGKCSTLFVRTQINVDTKCRIEMTKIRNSVPEDINILQES